MLSLIQPSWKVIGAVCASLLCVLTLAMQPATAEPRVALVIGNSDYKGDMPALPNPANDAKLMARTLKGLGFDVIDKENASQAELKQAIVDFGDRLSAAGRDATGLFFYAGHGVQVNGDNYLIPIDAQLKKEADVDLSAVGIIAVQKQMDFAGNAVNIIILDACRDNPLKGSSRGLKRGLAQVDATNGMFIAYSTSPDQTATDGNGINSPYTEALAKAMTEPGVSIGDVFQEVRTKVLAETGNKQRPWDSSSLTGRFYFKAEEPLQAVASTGATPSPESTQLAPPTQPVSPESTQPTASSTAGPDSEFATEKLYWDSVKDSGDADSINLYLSKYPNGYFVDAANAKLAELKGTQVASADTSQAGADRGAVAHDDNGVQSAPAAAPQVQIVAVSQTLYARGDGRVRSAPDAKGSLITQLPVNAQITATGVTTDRKWWRIDLGNGNVGYMHRSVVSDQPYVAAAQPQAPAAQPAPAQQPAAQAPADDSSGIEMVDQPPQPAAAPNPPASFEQAVGGLLSQLASGGSIPQPSQQAAQPQLTFAAYNREIVVRAGARVLSQPGNGQVIAQVSEPKRLPASARTPDGRWYQVTLPNGSIGYVSSNFVQR